MNIKQYYLSCLAHASYFVVDEGTKSAAVIDPQRDIDQYVSDAEKLGVSIRFVILTHFHADFVAGHLELAKRTGAKIFLGAQAAAEYEYEALADGDALEFGDVRLEVLETPGHTPEGISIVAKDMAKGQDPIAVFTGDTLFVGDVGRPDLLASVGVTSEELASMLYHSLHEKLMKLPDETLVYPAHGAGSLCGKNLGSETFTTIGKQRSSNYALQPMTKEEFREIVTAEQPAAPQYFIHDATMNKKDRILLDASMTESSRPITKERLLELMSEGVKVLDVRAPVEFTRGHVAGSMNAGLDGKFATWAGTVLAPTDRIAIIAESGDEKEATLRLGRIGLDQVVGYLDGGISAMGSDLESFNSVTVEDLAKELNNANNIAVLDVRGKGEYEGGHVEGALNVPLGELEARIAEVPTDRRVAVVCRSGYRSTVASAVLAAHGVRHLLNVSGGMDAWASAALPMVIAEGAAGSCSA